MSHPALDDYRATLRARRDEAGHRERRRREEALAVAHRAADLLRRRFDVREILLFGSVARNEPLAARSDVDLAVATLAPEDFFEAVAALQDVAPGVAVDLVALDRCPPTLRDVILREGLPL